MSKDIIRYADAAMYDSQPMLRGEEGARVTPRVFLLSATPDPLGAIAAGMRMFRGDPVYSIKEIDDDTRRWAWEESIKGHLKAPWEFVDFMFMIEGVTRSFTHQMVRQRTAVYAQESLRFAVKRGFAKETALPPMVAKDPEATEVWNLIVEEIDMAYEELLNRGIPAEDARGLLPHCTTTRLIYKTTLRGLLEHAGNRLCTQAQFEWRSVFMEIMKAIREYNQLESIDGENAMLSKTSWQFKTIGTPRAETFAPVCYKLGKCPFTSQLDRGCTIRDRVQDGRFDLIKPEEWMANPFAGITTKDNVRPD